VGFPEYTALASVCSVKVSSVTEKSSETMNITYDSLFLAAAQSCPSTPHKRLVALIQLGQVLVESAHVQDLLVPSVVKLIRSNDVISDGGKP